MVNIFVPEVSTINQWCYCRTKFLKSWLTHCWNLIYLKVFIDLIVHSSFQNPQGHRDHWDRPIVACLAFSDLKIGLILVRENIPPQRRVENNFLQFTYEIRSVLYQHFRNLIWSWCFPLLSYLMALGTQFSSIRMSLIVLDSASICLFNFTCKLWSDWDKMEIKCLYYISFLG